MGWMVRVVVCSIGVNDSGVCFLLVRSLFLLSFCGFCCCRYRRCFVRFVSFRVVSCRVVLFCFVLFLSPAPHQARTRISFPDECKMTAIKSVENPPLMVSRSCVTFREDLAIGALISFVFVADELPSSFCVCVCVCQSD